MNEIADCQLPIADLHVRLRLKLAIGNRQLEITSWKHYSKICNLAFGVS